MKALVVGAVEGTRVAVETVARAPGWELAGVLTLPPELASRHSDFVDLAPQAQAAGAQLLPFASSNSPEALAAIRDLAPDFTFVIGWSQICGPEFRAACGGNVIGYHPAPLPRLRGRAAIPWTIILDEKITASTLFWIDDGVDSGEILGQRYIHVAPRETAQSLYDKHMVALDRLLGDALGRIASGDVAREVQDESCATYATKRTPEDGRIDWSRSAAEIDRLIRGAGRPYPGAFTTYKGRKITCWLSELTSGAAIHAIPGQILERSEAAIAVMCGDGNVVRIIDYTLESEAKLPLNHAILGRPE